MKIYIDSDYKCHVSDDGTMRKFDVPFFNGKCAAFIEGYRYVPEGETWERTDGEVFRGEMIAPWKNYTELYIAQLEYDLADADAALNELGVNIDG
jgi:hypothetical protein